MADTDTARPARLSRGIRIVFGLSLALNLLVVGVVAGTVYRHGGPPGAFGASASLGAHLYRALPREDRRALRRKLRGQVDRAVLRQARIGPELDVALRADSFDAATVRALLNRQSEALEAGRSAMVEEWIVVISGKSAADRAAYADRVQERRRKHSGRDGPRP